jgi:two-component system, NtrC family, nitrogen regulation sensor histidine kinase GlnL
MNETAQPSLAELALAAASQAVLIVGTDDRIAFANNAAEEFLGLSAKVMARQPLQALLPFASPILGLIETVRRTQGSIAEYGIDLGTVRTGPKLADAQASPLAEGDRRVLLMIQERSMAQKMDRQLTHIGAARSISAMAAILAHEVKNPLAGIRGAAQLIEQNATAEDRQLTRLICEETDRIRKLVDRMETFADARPLNFRPVNIHEVLDHVRQASAAGFARTVRFHESYDPSLPPVLGDRDQLVQAFLNLVKNAAEAIGETGRRDGEIHLSTAFRPGMRLTAPGGAGRVALPLEAVIRDNGPGVPESLRSNLFDPFVTSKRSGSGLGLALVAKVVNNHGGVVDCFNEPGRTTFRILLPRAPASTEGQAA